MRGEWVDLAPHPFAEMEYRNSICILFLLTLCARKRFMVRTEL